MPRGWVQPSAPASPPKAAGSKPQGPTPLPQFTPRPASTQQSRGAAVLRRGTLFSQLAGQQAMQRHGPTLEQQQSLNILQRPNYHLGLARHDPVHATRVLKAANPGPVLQSVINQSPKLRANQQKLNDGLLKGTNSPKHSLADSITGFEGGLWHSAVHSLEHPVNVKGAKDLWNQSKAVNAFMASLVKHGNTKDLSAKQKKTLQQAGVLPQLHQGPISKIATDITGTGIGVFPGLGYRAIAASKSPSAALHQATDLTKQTVEAPYQFFRHPVRTYNQPGGSVQALMSVLAPLQLGFGAAARGAALRDLAESAKPGLATVRKPIRDVANSYVEEHGITPKGMTDAAKSWPPVSRDLAHHTAETVHEINSIGKDFHDFKDVTPVAVKDGEGNVHAVGAYARRTGNPGHIEALGLSSGTPGAGLQLIRHIASEARSKHEGITFSADPGAVDYYRKIGFHPIAEGSDMFVLKPAEVKAWADRIDREPWILKQYETAGRPVGARDVMGTLFRPRPVKREVTFKGKTVSSPAYKSALGGYFQKYGLDRALQKGLDDPHNSITARMIRNLRGDGFLARAGGRHLIPAIHQFTPAMRFGRRVAKEQQMKLDIAAGRPTYMVSPSAGPTAPATAFRYATFGKKDLEALRPSARLERMTAEQQKAMGPELAREAAAARSHQMTEWHHEVWNMSSPLTKEVLESPEWKNRELQAVRDPKVVNHDNFNPDKHMTEGQLAKRFVSFFGQRRHAESQPWNYRYIPNDVVAGMHPYLTTAGHGTVQLVGGRTGAAPMESFMANLDRVSQSVRVGRFFHPAYAQNAIQNRMFHLSQAGMFAFRNAYWYHHHFPELSASTKGGLEEAAGGSRAQALMGEQHRLKKGELTGQELGPQQLRQEKPGVVERLRSSGEKFWHNVDDRAVRIQMLYHELNKEGYRSNAQIENLFGKYNRGDPEAVRTVTAIAQRGRKEAIDYGEMTPIERQTLKRLFIAYGWTRGATTYSGRFGLQHPVQAAYAAELGREGDKKAHEFFNHAGGMMPDWLEGIMPLSHGKSPLAVETSWASPFQSPADLIKATGSVLTSPAQFSEQFNPGPAALAEVATGRGRYGQALPGMSKWTTAFQEQLLSRIRPVGAVEGMFHKKPTGTIVGGPATSAARLFGVPVEKIRDIEKTASGGLKTYRASLSPTQRAAFDHDFAIGQIPLDLQKMQRFGISPDVVGRYKGALASKALMDSELYKYAKSKNYPSWRRLPPSGQVQGAIKFMQQHYGMSADEAKQLQVAATALPDDTSLKKLVNGILAPAHAEQKMIDVWKKLLKAAKPPAKQKVYTH